MSPHRRALIGTSCKAFIEQKKIENAAITLSVQLICASQGERNLVMPAEAGTETWPALCV
jgi:hypothetical protein